MDLLLEIAIHGGHAGARLGVVRDDPVEVLVHA